MKIIEGNKIKALLTIAKTKDSRFDYICLKEDKMMATDRYILLQTDYSQQDIQDYPLIDGITDSADIEFDSDSVQSSFFEKIIKNMTQRSAYLTLNDTALIQKTSDSIEAGITDTENDIVFKTKPLSVNFPNADILFEPEDACKVCFNVAVLEKLIKAAKTLKEETITFKFGDKGTLHAFEMQQAKGFVMSMKMLEEEGEEDTEDE
jgi:hypothetical protein